MAIGRTIKYRSDKICKVTGILKNLPANTDFPIQVALSLATNDNATSEDWASNNGFLNTFVTVPVGMTYAELNEDLMAFTRRHESPEYFAKRVFFAQPLSSIHFDKRFGNYNNRTFSKELITALSLIGLFLLIVACINFINLSTAQAVTRAKEVGIRKVLGSQKKQLVWQFLSETFVVTLLSVIAGVAIAYAALSSINQLLSTNIIFQFNPTTLLFIVCVLMVVTILSDLYPAAILSGFSPITALKNQFISSKAGGISLRRALVVLQFTIAQALIISTMIEVRQMNYFANAPMGFDKDAVVTVNIPNDSLSQTKFYSLKTELLRKKGVKNVSLATFAITDENHWGSSFTFDNAAKPVDFNADLKWADADVFKTYNLKMTAGRSYQASDTVREFVVNEALVKQLGIRNPQDILGKKMSFWDGGIGGPVVGVVKNFNASSLADPMYPVVMAPWKAAYQTMAIKIQPESTVHTLASIQQAWVSAFPEYVYKFQFLDEKIASFYKQETQLCQLYKIFAAIAIFISCLGLYGLVSFMAVQRTKEIGIRKVLGASAGSIVYLFSKEFLLLIAVAFAIAAPTAYYFMHNWLNNFSFRISIGADVFIVTITASIVMACLTVSYRAIKAAIINPIRAIRIE
jgi:ABC-type antimicrobial peptide transport system permease subunit